MTSAGDTLADPAPPSLRDLERTEGFDGLVPAAVAALWSVALTAAVGPAQARAWVFIGGPLLLLAGLHGRTEGYLHARTRIRTLPLPLEPQRHFAAARPRHLRGLLMTGALGALAIALSLPARGRFDRVGLSMLLDWGWLWICAWGIERALPGVSAWLGRRFTPGTTAHQIQRSLGGGWTLPEAVVHLYAPALSVALAAAAAMPGQLVLDRMLDGTSVPPPLLAAATGGLGVVLVCALAGRRLYRRGFFEAVPWLAEATATLAGPPVPESTPGWVNQIGDPLLRVTVLQFLRTTPVPTLRLLCLFTAAGWAATGPLDLPHAAVVVAGIALWLVPARAVVRGRSTRAKMASTLPLPATQRRGRHPKAALLLFAPVALSMLVGIVGWSLP